MGLELKFNTCIRTDRVKEGFGSKSLDPILSQRWPKGSVRQGHDLNLTQASDFEHSDGNTSCVFSANQDLAPRKISCS